VFQKPNKDIWKSTIHNPSEGNNAPRSQQRNDTQIFKRKNYGKRATTTITNSEGKEGDNGVETHIQIKYGEIYYRDDRHRRLRTHTCFATLTGVERWCCPHTPPEQTKCLHQKRKPFEFAREMTSVC
jgi:hypothetical protein